MIYDILPVNNYCGNNSTTTFDFDFYIDNEEQLKVTLFNENSVQLQLVLNVDYSINEIKNPNGSFITFPLAGSSYGILTDEQKISIELSLPISQETQYNNSSLLNLSALEYSFDYLTRLVQIVSRKIALCVKVDEASDTTPQDLMEQINSKAVSCELNAQQTQQNLNTILEKYAAIVDINGYISDNYDKFLLIDSVNQKCDTKLNLNASNFSSDGKTVVTSFSFPSNESVDIANAGQLSSYTAPADGWFCVSGSTTGTGYITINSNSISVTQWTPASEGVSCYLPVSKDATVTINYARANISSIKFIYAKGEAQS